MKVPSLKSPGPKQMARLILGDGRVFLGSCTAQQRCTNAPAGSHEAEEWAPLCSQCPMVTQKLVFRYKMKLSCMLASGDDQESDDMD